MADDKYDKYEGLINSTFDKYDDYTYQKSNREKVIEPKAGIWWCNNCDRNLVALGKKCPVCKSINGRRNKVLLKKETNS